MRVQEVIVGVPAGAVATKDVLGDMRAVDIGNTRPRGAGLPVATHLGQRCRFEELVWLGVPELPFEADVDHVVAAKLVDEFNIDDEVGIASDVGSLDDQPS